MTETEKRKGFMLLIISEMLSYMGLSIPYYKGTEVHLEYLHTERTTVLNKTDLDKLLGFCGIQDLAYRYMWMVETDFFDKIIQCKFFNHNMFQGARTKKRIYQEAKTEGLSDICSAFWAYVINNHIEVNKKQFIFTKHENMHIKAIDAFFGFNIEDTLMEDYKALKSAKIAPQKIREYIKDIKGINLSVITDEVVNTVIDEIKEAAQHREGGLQKYLEDNTEKVIKEDVQTVFNYYVRQMTG